LAFFGYMELLIFVSRLWCDNVLQIQRHSTTGSSCMCSVITEVSCQPSRPRQRYCRWI